MSGQNNYIVCNIFSETAWTPHTHSCFTETTQLPRESDLTDHWLFSGVETGKQHEHAGNYHDCFDGVTSLETQRDFADHRAYHVSTAKIKPKTPEGAAKTN